MTLDLTSLKKRRHFLAANSTGLKVVTTTMIMQAGLLDEVLQAEGDNVLHVGYTVTKKLGNAVVRNRIKRRFRAAMREIGPKNAQNTHYYVLIGRSKALDCEFSDLIRDLRYAFKRVITNPMQQINPRPARGKKK